MGLRKSAYLFCKVKLIDAQKAASNLEKVLGSCVSVSNDHMGVATFLVAVSKRHLEFNEQNN